MTTPPLFRRLRRELQMTQEQLAPKLDVSQAVLCRIENGKSVPLLKVFVRAARLSRRCSVELQMDFRDYVWGSR
jgi:DNA-binding XRE family transcriptional regulator